MDRETVLDTLLAHPIAHFACHGTVEWGDPSRSRLMLHPAPLAVADIAALQMNGTLAYLSACDTTVTSQHLADESVHLASAFQRAGYQHVIGTLWPVNDHIAAKFAAEFYRSLTGNGTIPPDTDRSAHALHQATRHLRNRYRYAPQAWAAHTHAGP